MRKYSAEHLNQTWVLLLTKEDNFRSINMRITWFAGVFWYVSYPVLIGGIQQSDINNRVWNLKVRYDVIDNLQTTLVDKRKTYQAQITLVNEGTAEITAGDWALYLCSIRMIEEDHTAHNLQGFALPGGHGINVTHINGCLFKFAPNRDFKTMKHKDRLTLTFNASFWCVSRTDVMPNWYIATDGLQAQTITSTAGDGLSFVGPFENSKKWKRYPSDMYNPYTPQKRLELGLVRDLKQAPNIVIPTPVEVEKDNKKRKAFFGTGDWIVVAPKELDTEASRGEVGILAHPPTPPNFHEKFIFSHFFLPKPTETKITHPKSHFTYAIKHNFSLLISTQLLTLSSVCDQAEL